MIGWTAPQRLLTLGFLMLALNDVVFLALSGRYELYLADYGIKAALLLALLAGRQSWLKGETSPRPLGALLAVAAGCAVLGIVLDPLAAWIGKGWELFDWPAIENPSLRLLDLGPGLLLTAFVEETIFRRIALSVLPGPAWGRLLVSSLMFGLIHWGQGFGNIVETAFVGLVFGLAYLRTRSLAVVTGAHYATDLVLFM
jgi:membrane protease YdiL (CAAX protease family)